MCVGNLTIIGPDNGLSPGRRQAIIWTNAGILLIGPLGTNFSEIVIEIHTFSLKKMRFKLSSWKWRPFCLGLNVLISEHIPFNTCVLIQYTYVYIRNPYVPKRAYKKNEHYCAVLNINIPYTTTWNIPCCWTQMFILNSPVDIIEHIFWTLVVKRIHSF